MITPRLPALPCRPRMLQAGLLLFLAAAVVLLAACGSDSDDDSAEAAAIDALAAQLDEARSCITSLVFLSTSHSHRTDSTFSASILENALMEGFEAGTSANSGTPELRRPLGSSSTAADTSPEAVVAERCGAFVDSGLLAELGELVAPVE